MTVQTINLVSPPPPPFRFLAGLVCGLLIMAFSDLADFHVCVGQCDEEGWSIADFVDLPSAKKTDRLTMEEPQ